MLCHPIDCSTPGFPIYHQLLEPTQTQVHWVSDVLQPSHPLLFPFPAALNLSQHQGLFQWISSLHQWPKYWSFSFSISPSNEYSVLISFRIDRFDLLAVQGVPWTRLKSLLQHHSSKASVLQHSAFFRKHKIKDCLLWFNVCPVLFSNRKWNFEGLPGYPFTLEANCKLWFQSYLTVTHHLNKLCWSKINILDRYQKL